MLQVRHKKRLRKSANRQQALKITKSQRQLRSPCLAPTTHYTLPPPPLHNCGAPARPAFVGYRLIRRHVVTLSRQIVKAANNKIKGSREREKKQKKKCVIMCRYFGVQLAKTAHRLMSCNSAPDSAPQLAACVHHEISRNM